jgi:hypothetical protein
VSTSAKGYVPVKAKDDPVEEGLRPDVDRIRKILSREGFLVTAAEAKRIWMRVGKQLNGGFWIKLHDGMADHAILDMLSGQFEPIFE